MAVIGKNLPSWSRVDQARRIIPWFIWAFLHVMSCAAAESAPRAEQLVLELFHRPAQLAFGR